MDAVIGGGEWVCHGLSIPYHGSGSLASLFGWLEQRHVYVYLEMQPANSLLYSAAVLELWVSNPESSPMIIVSTVDENPFLFAAVPREGEALPAL